MSTVTLAEIRQAFRYYAGHRVTRGITYAASASLIATATIGIPQVIDAHATQTNRVATAHRLIDGQLDITETTRSELVEQITAAEKVAEQAGAEGALPAENSLAKLTDAIAGARTQLAALDTQTAATKKANASDDVHSWLPHAIGEQADDLGESFNELRIETVAAGKLDLAEATATVGAEMDAKAAADKKAADEKAAALAAEEAAAASEQAASQTTYSPSVAPQQQSQGTSAPATGGSCRAQAEALVASLSGAQVVWADLFGVRGQTTAGIVELGGTRGVVSLSSGSDVSAWCTPSAGYTAAHESAHSRHNDRYSAIADTHGYEWQIAHAESAADCIANQWGYAGSVYGCTAEGQELARLILG
ncbi:hypothetical protein [Leucobacter aridicollis]|uniref:Uncharacterized protein n=1 Tax=Leucobacter aridicollis TaxID=283878 RepID=A0A852RF81_9MICO|nr:hypothetical protein [Leucobacter aridicollis]MBL3682009.1 hypothetical protein [Leucobacter aridicollis]NYD26944.1 hypothetical protein [Leucobacter aridicollis]